MQKITEATVYVCRACDLNPIFTTVLIFLAMVFFNLFEALIEKLIFGHSFEHWLDPLFMGAFMAWAAYAVFICAQLKLLKEKRSYDRGGERDQNNEGDLVDNS